MRQHINRIVNELFGHVPQNVFAIVGHARTGSNFLSSALRSAGVFSYGEIFAMHPQANFHLLCDCLKQPQLRRFKWVGPKIFYYHLDQPGWDWFMSTYDPIIIHLVRQNKLNTAISVLTARSTNQWVIKGRKKSVNAYDHIIIDVRWLLDKMRYIEKQEKWARNYFDAYRMIEVSYEDLCDNLPAGVNRILKFLGMPSKNGIRSKTKKQAKKPLRERIMNYDELSAALIDNGYSAYLDI